MLLNNVLRASDSGSSCHLIPSHEFIPTMATMHLQFHWWQKSQPFFLFTFFFCLLTFYKLVILKWNVLLSHINLQTFHFKPSILRLKKWKITHKLHFVEDDYHIFFGCKISFSIWFDLFKWRCVQQVMHIIQMINFL